MTNHPLVLQVSRGEQDGRVSLASLGAQPERRERAAQDARSKRLHRRDASRPDDHHGLRSLCPAGGQTSFLWQLTTGDRLMHTRASSCRCRTGVARHY